MTDRFIIQGGHPLRGNVHISGSKNAALPLMAASLLTEDPIILDNVPNIADIRTMQDLLQYHGLSVEQNGTHSLKISGSILRTEAPYDIVSRMRASILVLGPLLTRTGKARVSLPGGCAIGNRRVNLHLKGLESLGATIELNEGYIRATAPRGLRGGRIVLPFASVGATENLLMAACLAKGQTEILNAAREPEISDLIDILIAMGAKITKQDGYLVINGVSNLHGTQHRIIPDRIECGTYACAAAITGGELHLLGGRLDHIQSLATRLNEAGVLIEQTASGLIVKRSGPLTGIDVMTETYPGFPTDMQAQIMALLTLAKGASLVTETIFENRFMHVPELCRLGAKITVHGSSAIIRGVPFLTGAPTMATDLRASFSLILAGLAAKGTTTLRAVHHLDRGYEDVDKKLIACGADIKRIHVESP